VHSRGLIHRDICTDNLLLERKTLRPRLANFDLSRVEGLQSVFSYAQDRLQLRKSAYAAPELLRATAPDEVDASCDVYSLGVVVFEVLTRTLPTRERPHEGRGLDRMAGITAEIATLVDRMLESRTDLRPTDTEVLRTLVGHLAREPAF
jgi:serine/threonine protein kinase